jgi:hypothetical protein
VAAFAKTELIAKCGLWRIADCGLKCGVANFKLEISNSQSQIISANPQSEIRNPQLTWVYTQDTYSRESLIGRWETH